SAITLLGLGLLVLLNPQPPIITIFLAEASLASINTFFMPAKSAAIPNLVPADRLLEANGLSAATQNLMPLIGLALSASVLGAVFTLFPSYFFATAILLNALSFAFSASCIYRLPPLIPESRATHGKGDSDVRASVWQD